VAGSEAKSPKVDSQRGVYLRKTAGAVSIGFTRPNWCRRFILLEIREHSETGTSAQKPGNEFIPDSAKQRLGGFTLTKMPGPQLAFTALFSTA
jgi:hypothetical protein